MSTKQSPGSVFSAVSRAAGIGATLCEYQSPDGIARPMTIAVWPDYEFLSQGIPVLQGVVQVSVIVDGRESIRVPDIGPLGVRREVVACSVKVTIRTITGNGGIRFKGFVTPHAAMAPPSAFPLPTASGEPTRIPNFCTEFRLGNDRNGTVVIEFCNSSGVVDYGGARPAALFTEWTPLPHGAMGVRVFDSVTLGTPEVALLVR